MQMRVLSSTRPVPGGVPDGVASAAKEQPIDAASTTAMARVRMDGILGERPDTVHRRYAGRVKRWTAATSSEPSIGFGRYAS